MAHLVLHRTFPTTLTHTRCLQIDHPSLLSQDPTLLPSSVRDKPTTTPEALYLRQQVFAFFFLFCDNLSSCRISSSISTYSPLSVSLSHTHTHSHSHTLSLPLCVAVNTCIPTRLLLLLLFVSYYCNQVAMLLLLLVLLLLSLLLCNQPINLISHTTTRCNISSPCVYIL